MKVVVGITGTIASGKGRAAQFFKENGFEHHSLSQEIRAIAKERGLPINRETLSKLGSQLRAESKESILAKRVAKNIKGRKKYFVIDGIRDMSEVKYFQKHFHFYLIGIDADPHIRFQRLKKRRRKGDPDTFEDFLIIDRRERRAGGGQEVQKCLMAADFLISNDGTLEEFHKNLKKVLSKIRDDVKHLKR
jgi:dephospho-CoA kinase